MKLLVIGSINIDLVIDTKILPKKGETVVGKSFKTFPGGKGANQAIAASRFGAKVDFLGCVGEDEFGTKMIDNLKANKVGISLISKSKVLPTGTAIITLNEGDNSIIVIPGANSAVNKKFIKKHEKKILQYNYILIQNEIDKSAIEEIIRICNNKEINIVYNPAPIEKIDNKTIHRINYITPNETEYQELLNFGLEIEKKKIIITKGKYGVQYMGNIIGTNIVQVVDTTGAGDTFNGCFVACLMTGFPVVESIKLACKAATISTLKKGAQDGMPTMKEVL